MQSKRVWARALGLERDTVIEEVREDGEVIVVACRLRKNAARRCGICSARAPRYDRGEPRPRRWRALDAGTTKVFIEADVPRVRCRSHGVTVAAVPWRRNCRHRWRCCYRPARRKYRFRGWSRASQPAAARSERARLSLLLT